MMIRHKFCFAILILPFLFCCNSSVESERIHHTKQKDAQLPQKAAGNKKQSMRFQKIAQLYADTSSTNWTDEGSFDWLYFEPGKIYFDFNPSCGYWFPTKLKRDKIVFYWARNMNCNFQRGLDTTFKSVKSPEIGKTFGEVLLVNGTTIRINYYYKDWVRKVNEAERSTIIRFSLPCLESRICEAVTSVENLRFAGAV